MANDKILHGGLIIKGSLGSGSGDDLLTISATGQVRKISGTPLTTTLTSANIFVGNASNVATAVAVTGDVTIDNTGVTAITSGVIVNADINASAAIAVSKLAAVTASRALVSDGSGFIAVSATTATELGYVSGVTSSIQTQLNGKQATITGAATTVVSANLANNAVVISNSSGKLDTSVVTDTELGYLAGTTSSVQTQIDGKLSVTLTSPADGDIIRRTSGAWSNLAVGSNGQVLTVVAGAPAWANSTTNGLPAGGTTNQYLRKDSNTDYDVAWDTLTLDKVTDVTATAAEVNILSGATLTTTELNYVDGVTSNIQTQLDNKQNKSLAYNAIWVGDAANLASQLAAGSNDQVLTIVGGVPQWVTPTPPGNVSSATAPSVDNELTRYNGTVGNSIQGGTGITISDAGAMSFPNAGAIQTGTTASDTLLFRAYDNDTGPAYTTFITLTAGNTPTCDLSDSVTKSGQYIYRASGTDVALADGGTGVSLADPGANRLWGWDDTDNAIVWITIGAGLSYDAGTNTLSSSGAAGVTGPGASTDNAIARWDGVGGGAIQNSGVIIDDTNNVSGVVTLSATNVTLAAGGALRTSTSDTNTLILQAYDVDGAVYTTFGTLTAGNTPTFDLSDSVTKSGQYIYRAGGTDVSLADGGTGASLTDPNADRILFWDDSGGAVTWLALDSELEIVGTNIGIAANGVDDAHIRQSAGLSVIGRGASTTGNVADITAGTDNQVLRRSGTSLAFGAVNLASSDAVTGTLAIGNGGTGSTAGAWLLSGTSTLGGSTTVTSNAASQHVFNGTWTASANNQQHAQLTGTITARATVSDNLRYLVIDPTLVAGAASQTLDAFRLNPTFTPGVHAPTSNIARMQLAGTDRWVLRDDGALTHTTTVSGTYSTWRDATNIHFRLNSSGSMFLGNTANARIGSATNGSATFSVASGSLAYQADVSHFWTTQSATTITGASAIKYQASGTIDASSGSNTGTFYKLVPTYNISASTGAKVYDFLIEPVETALANTTHYGIVNSSTTALNGFGTATPTAVLDVGASSTSRSGFRMRSGTAPTSPNAGDFWFDGTNLKFYDGTTTRTITWT